MAMILMIIPLPWFYLNTGIYKESREKRQRNDFVFHRIQKYLKTVSFPTLY
jgi:hypothetical protein